MTKRQKVTPAFEWDKFSLYELCAQHPARDAAFLLAIYSGPAAPRKGLVLGEDFCGAAALSRAWCTMLPADAAIGVDHDGPTIARARQDSPDHPRVRLIRSDVRRVREPADLIAVLNFSICELHERRDLVGYLRHARTRLRRAGCLICDVYGGADAFQTGLLDERIRPPKTLPNGSPHPARRDRITYSWEQRSADPLTGRVVNAMHFEVIPPTSSGRKRQGFVDAFVYDWRLWSIPELRDAMSQAGFPRTEVYPRTADAIDERGRLHVRPIDDHREVGDSFNVFVVGRC